MAKKEDTEAPESVNDPVSAMAALRKEGFDNFMGLGTAWAEAVSDMSAEMLGFLSDRIKEDLKTQHRLLHCKDMQEFHDIQADFLQRAIDQYQIETGKLIEMSTTAFSEMTQDKKGS